MNVYQKIRRAAKRGTGLRLSDDEVWGLARDEAIIAAADGQDALDADPVGEMECRAAEDSATRFTTTKETP